MDGLYHHFKATEDARPVELSISSQHYMFPTDALQTMINADDILSSTYKITLREGYTSEVVDDVLTQRSQLGILYLSQSNERFLTRLFNQKGIVFTPLGEYTPHIYVRKDHPLTKKASVSVHDLADYPYIRYDQRVASQQYSEEIVITGIAASRQILVTERSGMLNIIRNTDAFNIGTGCMCHDIVGERIVSIPITGCYDTMTIGHIHLRNALLDDIVHRYMDCLHGALQRCRPV